MGLFPGSDHETPEKRWSRRCLSRFFHRLSEAERFLMTDASHDRRVISVQRPLPVVDHAPTGTVRRKRLGDFPGVAKVHLQVAKRLSSPLLMGPPICDELIALVQHLFTEEEAALVRHLRGWPGRTAADLARAERCVHERIQACLHQLAVVKRAISSQGAAGKEKYCLLPIMPGIFEMVLIGSSPDTISPWHRRFAELFEALYETGYARQYQLGRTRPTPFVRVLPIGRTIEAHPMALPSDRLEVVLDRYKTFGIGQCQCRLTTTVAGRGCGKPLGNCAVMGEWAERGIAGGLAGTGLPRGAVGHQTRSGSARLGDLDDEHRIGSRADLVFLLRLLLPCDADGHRVPGAGGDGARAFPAAPGRGPLHGLQQVRRAVSDASPGDRRRAENAAAPGSTVHRLRPVRGRLPTPRRNGHATGAPLRTALPQLVLAALPRRPRHGPRRLASLAQPLGSDGSRTGQRFSKHPRRKRTATHDASVRCRSPPSLFGGSRDFALRPELPYLYCSSLSQRSHGAGGGENRKTGKRTVCGPPTVWC
jgi:hypothetical protein